MFTQFWRYLMQRGSRFTTETKQAFKTTEFWAMVVLIVAILVSAAAIKGGDNGTDEFIARQAWLYASIVGGAYFIGRGLAKSGSSEPYWQGGTNEGFDGADGQAADGARGDRVTAAR
jgi:hypothetical protein